jgi:hypothetical protein
MDQVTRRMEKEKCVQNFGKNHKEERILVDFRMDMRLILKWTLWK